MELLLIFMMVHEEVSLVMQDIFLRKARIHSSRVRTAGRQLSDSLAF